MKTGPEGVVVEVSDSGSGISAQHMKRVFDPFFTTKPIGEGTGLGLSICHGIVTGFGGAISAEPRSGGGTTFRVSLPPGTLAAKVRAPETRPVELARGRILAIDDEPALLRSYHRLLGRDYEVVTATNAQTALDLLRGGRGLRRHPL